MIIEKLITYAQNATDSEGEPILADSAFPSKETVNYLITINTEGVCLKIYKTGNEIKQGKKLIWKYNQYRIPAIGDRSSEKQAGLLCDVASYIFGPGPWSVKTKQDGTVSDDSAKHSSHAETFRKVLEKAISAVPGDEALCAVKLFYEQYASDFESLLKQHNLWLEVNPRTKKEVSVIDAKHRFAFELNGDYGPAFKRPELQEYWRKYCRERLDQKSSGRDGVSCLACGDSKPPVSNHERTIKNIPGSKILKGVKLVSFDGRAFRSHGLEQSLNAAMCQDCVDAYTIGLKHLLEKGSSNNYIDSDAEIAYTFWSRSPVAFNLNAVYVKADEDAVKDLYESLNHPTQRESISETEANEFYVLALSASGARAIVRDWIETHLPSVQRNIAQWFRDLTITTDPLWKYNSGAGMALPDRFGAFSLHTLCRSVGRKTKQGWEVPIDLSSRLFRAGLTGSSLPDSVLDAALRRVRDDHDIPPPRAALIKMVLHRLHQSHRQGENEMSETLDPDKPDIAYVCGRLLAVLDRIQRLALGRLNATIIDRYYGAASTAPRPIFPRLLSNAQNHLGKLRGERPWDAENLQKDLETVASKIGNSADWVGDLPQWLDLEAQGRFAIGFYHQRADYRSRAKKSPPDDHLSQSEPKDDNLYNERSQ